MVGVRLSASSGHGPSTFAPPLPSEEQVRLAANLAPGDPGLPLRRVDQEAGQRVQGRRPRRPVRTLCRTNACDAGANTLLWNATSDRGLPVPNGTYLVEVMAKAGDGARARGLTQVRLDR